MTTCRGPGRSPCDRDAPPRHPRSELFDHCHRHDVAIRAATKNPQAICDGTDGRYELDVIDIYQQLTRPAKIIAADAHGDVAAADSPLVGDKSDRGACSISISGPLDPP